VSSSPARYSSFRHLCDALFFKDGDLLMILGPLTLYADASGKKRDALITVGGFVSTVDEWKLFDTEWSLALRENDLDYFHMVEFAHSVGQFKKGWKGNEPKRQAFLNRLIGILAFRAKFSVGAGVLMSAYREVDQVYELHERFNPFPLCGITCVDQAVQYRDRAAQYSPIEFIFERGDEDRGQLIAGMKRFVQQEPIFRCKKKTPALQAADFTAYEQHLATRATSVELGKLFLRWRTSFQRLFHAVPSWHGTFDDVTNLRLLCRRHEIPKRRHST
jgi:hypothetical protein